MLVKSNSKPENREVISDMLSDSIGGSMVGFCKKQQ
jgi:hypothetical protein